MFIVYVTHLVLVLKYEIKIAAKLETVYKYASRNRNFKKRVFLYSNSFLSNKSVHCYGVKSNTLESRYPAGSKKIEKDRNWGMGKDKTFLSLPTHHFASPKLYLFLSPHLSRVTGNIYLFLSLCLVISIFSYPLVYPLTEAVSIFFYLFLYLSWSTTYLFLSPNYLSTVQILISLYIPQYLFLPRNKEYAVPKSTVSILHRGRLLLHWP